MAVAREVARYYEVVPEHGGLIDRASKVPSPRFSRMLKVDPAYRCAPMSTPSAPSKSAMAMRCALGATGYDRGKKRRDPPQLVMRALEENDLLLETSPWTAKSTPWRVRRAPRAPALHPGGSGRRDCVRPPNPLSASSERQSANVAIAMTTQLGWT